MHVGEPLDPVVPRPTRNNQAKRSAMGERQRFTVHAVSDEGVWIKRAGKRDAANEGGNGGLGRNVRARQPHMRGTSFNTRALQNIAKTDAGPRSLAHRTVFPLHAGNAGLKEAAPISG